MTVSRPGLERRSGTPKKRPPFDPEFIMVVDVHAPWGELCYESIDLFEPKKPGQGSRHRKWFETFSDLLPSGGPWFRFETDARPLAEAVHAAVCE